MGRWLFLDVAKPSRFNQRLNRLFDHVWREHRYNDREQEKADSANNVLAHALKAPGEGTEKPVHRPKLVHELLAKRLRSTALHLLFDHFLCLVANPLKLAFGELIPAVVELVLIGDFAVWVIARNSLPTRKDEQPYPQEVLKIFLCSRLLTKEAVADFCVRNSPSMRIAESGETGVTVIQDDLPKSKSLPPVPNFLHLCSINTVTPQSFPSC